MIFLIVLTIIVILLLYGIGVYNKLVALKNTGLSAWSDVDVQLKRRHDLIPNLVETVKGYMVHERTTLENVTKARSLAVSATDIGKKEEAENMLTGFLRQLFAVVENYPDLKANQNFLELQNSLNGIENDIQLSRRYYNAVVRDYNVKREVFPNNIIASFFPNFPPMKYFQMPEEERETPQVTFPSFK